MPHFRERGRHLRRQERPHHHRAVGRGAVGRGAVGRGVPPSRDSKRTTASRAARRDGSPHLRPARRAGPTIFGLRKAVKLWYHSTSSNAEEFVFEESDGKTGRAASTMPPHFGGFIETALPSEKGGIAMRKIVCALAFVAAVTVHAATLCVTRQTETSLTFTFAGFGGLDYELFVAHGATDGGEDKHATRPPTSTRSPPRCATDARCASSSRRRSASTWRRN